MYCVYTILAFRRDSDGWQPKKKTSKSNTLHGPRKPESDLLGTFNKKKIGKERAIQHSLTTLSSSTAKTRLQGSCNKEMKSFYMLLLLLVGCVYMFSSVYRPPLFLRKKSRNSHENFLLLLLSLARICLFPASLFCPSELSINIRRVFT